MLTHILEVECVVLDWPDEDLKLLKSIDIVLASDGEIDLKEF